MMLCFWFGQEVEGQKSRETKIHNAGIPRHRSFEALRADIQS